MVDLDQARRGDLLVHHPVGIDQEGARLARHARRDVVGHHVGHAVEIDQPVAGGEVDARLPLGREQRDFIDAIGNVDGAFLQSASRARRPAGRRRSMAHFSSAAHAVDAVRELAVGQRQRTAPSPRRGARQQQRHRARVSRPGQQRQAGGAGEEQQRDEAAGPSAAAPGRRAAGGAAGCSHEQPGACRSAGRRRRRCPAASAGWCSAYGARQPNA